MKNYYEILEVNKKASKEVIEKAYKVLAKKYHPDRHTGVKKEFANKKIKEINEAYEVLSDEFLKEQYDAELEKEEFEIYLQRQQTREKNQNNGRKKQEISLEERMKKHKTGSMGATIELTKQLIKDLKNKDKRKEIKEVTKADIIAILLTIIVVALIGVVLWFIPFTNGWMRELLFENQLFNWIGNLFN